MKSRPPHQTDYFTADDASLMELRRVKSGTISSSAGPNRIFNVSNTSFFFMVIVATADFGNVITPRKHVAAHSSSGLFGNHGSIRHLFGTSFKQSSVYCFVEKVFMKLNYGCKRAMTQNSLTGFKFIMCNIFK